MSTLKQRLVGGRYSASLVLVALCAMLQSGCMLRDRSRELNPCKTALECAEIEAFREAGCRTAPGMPNDFASDRKYGMRNWHQSKTLWVSYERKVRHVNSPDLEDSSVALAKIAPKAREPLDCWRKPPAVPAGTEYDELSFSILAACFDDECPSGPDVPSKTRDPKTTCQQLCDNRDDSCLRVDILNNTPEERLVTRALRNVSDRFITTPAGRAVDLAAWAALSNAYTGTDSCERDPMQLTAAGRQLTYQGTGSSCHVGFEPQSQNIALLELSLPGEWRGSLNRTRSEFMLNSEGERYAPIAMITEDTPKHVVKEWITAIEATRVPRGSSHRLVFTGAKYYCAEIIWLDEGFKAAGPLR